MLLLSAVLCCVIFEGSIIPVNTMLPSTVNVIYGGYRAFEEANCVCINVQADPVGSVNSTDKSPALIFVN